MPLPACSMPPSLRPKYGAALAAKLFDMASHANHAKQPMAAERRGQALQSIDGASIAAVGDDGSLGIRLKARYSQTVPSYQTGSIW